MDFGGGGTFGLRGSRNWEFGGEAMTMTGR